MIPLSESHLRFALKFWIAHYNGGRPHMSLGPGIPNAPAITSVRPQPSSRHRRGDSHAVRSKSILGGLHHEYSLAVAGPDLFCGQQAGWFGEVSALRSGCEV
jgi:putative transposase